jgi:hypothetical protein
MAMRPTIYVISCLFVSASARADDAVIEHAPESTPRYPRAVIARPLTLPARVALFGADATGNRDLSAIGTAPIAGAGITDELEVQVPYTFATREFEGQGTLSVDIGYALLRGAVGGKLEAIARARTGYDFLTDAAMPLALGVHVQYNATPWLAIISGVPGAQQFRIALEDDAVMGRPIELGLPIGIGVQPTGALYLQLDTKLASLGIADAEHVVIGRDATPVALTAVYNIVREVDVQAAIGADFNDAGDTLTFLVGARYYAGRL